VHTGPTKLFQLVLIELALDYPHELEYVVTERGFQKACVFEIGPEAMV
jgi:hypothetical protein